MVSELGAACQDGEPVSMSAQSCCTGGAWALAPANCMETRKISKYSGSYCLGALPWAGPAYSVSASENFQKERFHELQGPTSLLRTPTQVQEKPSCEDRSLVVCSPSFPAALRDFWEARALSPGGEQVRYWVCGYWLPRFQQDVLCFPYDIAAEADSAGPVRDGEVSGRQWFLWDCTV